MNMNTENVIARCWALAEAILKANRTACLHGPAGTGKTYAAQRVGLKEGAPEPITVTLTSDTSAADLMGYYINTPDGFQWNDGPALRAWRCGARLVVNEADKANGDAESALHVIADESGSAVYVTAAGETMRPSPGFHCIATTNADPAEAFRSEGVADRFSVRVHVNQPHPAAIAALPEDLRKAAASTWNSDPKITMRQWRAFAELRGCMSSDTAAELVFGARASAVLDSLTIASA